VSLTHLTVTDLSSPSWYTPGFEDTGNFGLTKPAGVVFNASMDSSAYNLDIDAPAVFGAEIKEKDLRMPLARAQRFGNEAVVELLLRRGGDLEHKDSNSSMTPLKRLSASWRDKVGNLAMPNKGADNPDDLHGRIMLQCWLVPFNGTKDSIGVYVRYDMSCEKATNRNEVDCLCICRIRPFCRCSDIYATSSAIAANTSSGSSSDQESLFDQYKSANTSLASSSDQESLFDQYKSGSDTTTTVSSSTGQQGLTHTNIDHMLAVLKARRDTCLGELREFDTALETLDQLENTKRHGSKIFFDRVCLNDVSLS
jgi:hypothetical protein